MFQRRWGPWLSIVWALAGGSCAFAQAVLPEVLVTRTFIADFEFDWGRDGVHCAACNGGAGNARFTFTDANNMLWVGNVDRDTGAFVPTNGRGVLVDTDAAQALDFGNGPEWVNTAQGSQIAYVKYKPGMEHTPANSGLAVAGLVGGAWSGAFVPGGDQRSSVIGSLDIDDPLPRLLYQNNSNFRAYWRYTDDPSSETLLPSDRPVCSRRWVPGQHAVVYTAPCLLRDTASKPAQAYWYDLLTGVEQQITFDAGFKLYAFAWRAPEFGNDFVLFTVSDRTTLVIYRQVTNGDGTKTWTLINTIRMPPELPYVASPESFVHNGKSYVVMQVSTSISPSDFKVPTQIALTGIDPALPSFRLLTNDNSTARVRMDPEYYITSQGPYIYYNRYVAATATTPLKLDGVWRVDTGLGPPLALRETPAE